MESRTILPFDILEYIVDLLADGLGLGDYGLEDIESLQMLSQTCKFMVPLCRKHLFSCLRLHTTSKSERFSNLLSKNPDIARYVRILEYTVYIPTDNHELNILDMLKERSSLQSIELLTVSGFDWRDLPESIRSSLISLIQLPTITHLVIRSFKGFPATALSGCSNLIDLRLVNIEIVPPEANQVILRSKIPTPVSLYAKTSLKSYDGLATLMNSASLRAGGPIVDFSRLQGAYFDANSGEIGHINELIKATTQLLYFYIRGEWLALSLYPSNFWQRIL